MADGQEYHFRIGAYSPKTLPLGRLIKYLAQIERLYSGSDKVHLVGALKTNSTSLPMFVEGDFEDEFVVTPVKASRGEASATQNEAFKQLAHLSYQDGKPLFLCTSANDNIFEFPMRPVEQIIEEDELDFEGIKKQMTIIGRIYRLGSSAPTAKINQVWIEEKFTKKRFTNAWATNAQVREFADKFKNYMIIDGTGTLNRKQNGEWDLIRFDIDSFSTSDDAPKSTVFQEIEKAGRVWPSDILSRLYDSEEEDG